MLIGIDASRANNDQKTGVEWYAWQVIEELKKIIPAEHRVILYTREPLQGDLAKLPAPWQERVLSWLPRRLWTQLRLAWEMWQEPPDLLFVPAHVLPPVHPKKAVITIHDLGGLRFPGGFSLFERWYNQFSTRTALKKATVITISNFCKQEIRHLFPSAREEKIKVIYNGYDQSNYFYQPPPLTPNFKPATFITISRLEEKKNTLGLVQAFEIFLKNNPQSDHRLVLIGKPGYGFEQVARAIARSPYQERIVLSGWMETNEAAELMRQATALVFPSFYEGFGIPVLEAMASGVPVIASQTGALPEICGPAAILVNPNKPGEMAAAMKEVLEPALRQQLIEAGLQRAAQFSWSKCASELWQFIEVGLR